MDMGSTADEHDHTWDDPDYTHDDVMNTDPVTDVPTGKGDGNVEGDKGSKTGMLQTDSMQHTECCGNNQRVNTTFR